MGIFGRIFKPVPTWARRIPHGLRPSRSQISQIETIRQHYNLRHDEIHMHLMSHPWTTRRVLRHGYETLKKTDPSLDHASLLAALLRHRLDISGSPSLLGVTRVSSESATATVLSRFRSVEKFADAITHEEQADSFIHSTPGFHEPAKKIFQVLQTGPLPPSVPNHDLVRFLKEREKSILIHNFYPSLADAKGSSNWGAEMAERFAELSERLNEVDRMDGVPKPRFGRAFDVKQVAGHTLAALYLADFEWAALFTKLLHDVDSVLQRVPEHILLRHSFGLPAEYMLLLFKATASTAKWSFTAETEADWLRIHDQLLELVHRQNQLPKSKEARDRAEIEAMIGKRMLRCGVIDDANFYAIQAGQLDGCRWEAWLASGFVSHEGPTGSVSATLKIASNVEDLETWARHLTDGKIRQIVKRSASRDNDTATHDIRNGICRRCGCSQDAIQQFRWQCSPGSH